MLSHLCASTVASWFVDVYRVAGPGLEARECLQDPGLWGRMSQVFRDHCHCWGMHTCMQALLLQQRKNPIPSTHAQRYISENKFRNLNICNRHVNVTENKFQKKINVCNGPCEDSKLGFWEYFVDFSQEKQQNTEFTKFSLVQTPETY